MALEPGFRLSFRERGAVLHCLLEKTPFFVLSVVFSVITYTAQQSGDAMRSLDVLSASARIQNAGTSYATYILYTFFPRDLSIFYPHSGAVIEAGKVLVSIVFLLISSVFVNSVSALSNRPC